MDMKKIILCLAIFSLILVPVNAIYEQEIITDSFMLLDGSPQEFAAVKDQIVEISKNTVGFDKKRGDKLTLMIIPFRNDEADQATIDTAPKSKNPESDDYNPTVINGRIREMLHLFQHQ